MWSIPEGEFTVRYQSVGSYLTERADGMVVALDTTIDDALREEGVAMDLNRFTQDMRKEAGYDVSDRIELEVEGELSERWVDWLADSTLADLTRVDDADLERSLSVDERSFTIKIKRI